MLKIWISHQNRLKLQTGVADPIFELCPWNLVRIDIGLCCKRAEIFIRISQMVLDLAKISVSVPSISWGVLDPTHHDIFFNWFIMRELIINSILIIDIENTLSNLMFCIPGLVVEQQSIILLVPRSNPMWNSYFFHMIFFWMVYFSVQNAHIQLCLILSWWSTRTWWNLRTWRKSLLAWKCKKL